MTRALRTDGRASQTRLYCVRSHRLFGNATGLARVQLEAKEGQDERDRVLVSFKDAKVSLYSAVGLAFPVAAAQWRWFRRATSSGG